MLKTQRADYLILDDIRRIIINYPPLANDRHHINYDVKDGVITLSGYVRTQPNVTYLMSQLQQIEGLVGLVTDHLYTDESLRFEIGRVIPFGVQVRVEYGNVILAGRPVDAVDVQAVLQIVSQVAGVRRVVNAIS
jgi:osmotically-inducible protein OsmY